MNRPLAITGAHRSGTSMVARAAQQLGLWLGDPDDLLPPAADNPEGFYEHRQLVAASDTLFQQLGAGWDCPPSVTAADLRDPALDVVRGLARPALEELAAHPPWAWKDPRLAPVLPFWLDLVPAAGVVLCLRNPLEAAASLRARNGTSLALGLRLWYRHMKSAIEAAPDRLVTHYDAWFSRPEAELERLAAYASFAPDPARRRAAAAVPARHLRHARFDAPALRTARVHPDLRDLYERLRAEAGWSDGGHEFQVALDGDGGRALTEPPSSTEDLPVGHVQPWVVDVGVARYEVHKRNGRVAQLERQLVAATTEPPISTEDLQASIYDLQLALAELTARVVNGIDAERRKADVAYARMIRWVRAEVRRLVPADADLLVLSDGEPALVDLHGRPARHFPVGTSAVAPGPHPATGAEAAALLVAQQALGATHLVVPATASWWLGAYPELTGRLATAATTVARADDGSTIHRLHGPIEPARHATITAALAHGRRRLGADVSVLDATASGNDLRDAFRPPDPGPLLYADRSIGVVVIDGGADAGRRADARRVASFGVLAGGPDGWSWSWTGPPEPISADVVLLAAPVPHPAAYFDVFTSTLPAGHAGEVVVAAPTGAVDLWRHAVGSRARAVPGRAGEVLAESVRRSSADYVVLVDGTAIPLDGWLPALLTPFARSSRVGLVGGRRRMPAGTPVVAAVAVGGDGIHVTPGVEGDRLARPIDVATPGLVACRRELLAEHGFDDGYATIEFAIADHCWALEGGGYDCFVQPEAETADLGLGGPDEEHLAVDRARFDDAWAGSR